MRESFLLAAACLAGSAASAQDVARIWDQAPHSAFTDLTRFDNRFVCCFREGDAHVFGADGRVRVIASADGETWESVGLIAQEGTDLRDPKVSATSDGRLMVLMGGSVYEGRSLIGRVPQVAFADSLQGGFGAPLAVEIDAAIRTDNDWLWRVTWHEGLAWGVVYQIGDGENTLRLLRSEDGVRYAHVATLGIEGKPNETTIRFDADGRMLALVRREGGDRTGLVGVAAPPYDSWEWTALPVRLGGPDLLVGPGGGLIACSRRYPAAEDDATRTVVAALGLDGEWNVLVTLPSGGDTSYPGMLVHGEELWVSYYSAHEGKSAIYLARLPLADLGG